MTALSKILPSRQNCENWQVLVANFTGDLEVQEVPLSAAKKVRFMVKAKCEASCRWPNSCAEITRYHKLNHCCFVEFL